MYSMLLRRLPFLLDGVNDLMLQQYGNMETDMHNCRYGNEIQKNAKMMLVKRGTTSVQHF